MEGVPPPLQVGSPTTARRASVDHVPSALRVGSPSVERGTPPMQQRPPLMRQNTSSSDRVAQLFPSRPASIVSASGEWPSSKRTSHPTPLVAASESSYRIPRAPAPPSFSSMFEGTSYVSSPDPFAQQHSSPAIPDSRARHMLNRLASIGSRRSTRSKGSDYNRLEDEESRAGGGRLRGLEEVDESDEPIGYDLSGYDGLPLDRFEASRKVSTAESMRREQALNEAGHAAEYERLEAQLGAGMSSVLELPFTHQPSGSGTRAGHRRGLIATDAAEAAASQSADIRAMQTIDRTGDELAAQTGGIVAVAEVPVDISESFGGSDLENRSELISGTSSDKAVKTSYYFPPDPDMPAWRPFSMGWPWLAFLVIIALVLAGLQEWLCQLSMKRAKDPEKLGLVKFKKPQELPLHVYFTWKYAPVLFFVIYGIMWQITDHDVKRLEPFYQLSKKTGATAGESLNMDYLTFMSWLVPLRALRHKQYAVIYASISTLLTSSLVPILQSASVNVYPPKEKRQADSWKYIRIDPRWSRAVTACLILAALSGCILIYEMRRKSGLLSDPKGIAGVAAMATRSHILTDFRGLDTAPLEKIHKQLRHRRFILHKSSLWQGEYISNSKEKIQETGTDPRPPMLRLWAGILYMVFLISFTIAIPIVMFVEGANKVTEKVPFLLTALAIWVKLLWGTINNDIRMLEPFLILSRRNAPGKTLTLDYSGTNPIFLPVQALLNKHYIVALVGFGGILTEVLTVCIASLSVDGRRFIPGNSADHDEDPEDDSRQNTDETFRSFWVSLSLVMGILIMLVCVACLVYVRRSHKFMPRQIGTIASILAFIHQSKMLVTFVDTETFDSTRMTQHLEKQGKKYALGWFRGRDGEDHCGIDEEPIWANYEYGVDRTQEHILPNQASTWEHF